MKSIKMLGAALLACAAFLSVGVNAQQTPVACSWAVISSYGPPNNTWRDIVRECRTPASILVATQSFRGYNGTGIMENCVITTASNFSYTGTCSSPSFYAPAPTSSAQSSSTSSCNSGAFISAGCAGMTSSPNFGYAVQSACGSTSCAVRYENYSAINGCGQQNPYLKAYCQ